MPAPSTPALPDLCAILEDSPDACALLRASDGSLVWVNDAFSTVHGATTGALLGRPLADLGVPAVVADSLARVQKGGGGEAVVQEDDGDARGPVRVVHHPVRGAGGVDFILHQEGAWPPTSARPRPPNREQDALRRELESLRRRHVRRLDDMQRALVARDDFMGVAAHELRTPLTSLLLQLHTLRRRAAEALQGHPAAAAIHARLDAFRSGCERLAQLTDAMLDVAAIAHGPLAVKLEAVDLARVVEGVVAQVTSAGDAERAGCRLETRVAPEVTGHWDRTRLEQLLHHLVANALKYGAGHPVEIALTATPGEAVLTVRDGGPGVDAAARAHLFE
ncbi:MAG TPA: PAS domain-containing sensor histidine kinase, partial [Myxococcota bacterium]|nr:PAS domain-containing sensor histidine kinase [Myxococcota bacterium]